ncbi:MAG: hypothetical protein ACRDYZ_12090 [Acidimicrobiales bacterium]
MARGGTHDDDNLAGICPSHKAQKDEADRLEGIRLRARRRPRTRPAEAHPNTSRT